jgi:hypothetical protein
MVAQDGFAAGTTYPTIAIALFAVGIVRNAGSNILQNSRDCFKNDRDCFAAGRRIFVCYCK